MGTISFKHQEIRPGKIVCIARNYASHAKELNNPVPENPVFFMKPSSSIADGLTLQNRVIRYEAEISILYRHDGNHGIGFGLDLTLQDVQNTLKEKGHPWEAAKSFADSAIFSAFRALSEFMANDSSINENPACWNEFGIEMKINGNIVQKDNPSSMIFTIPAIIQKAHAIFGLEENDILMTGTPAGVGLLKKDDSIEGTITYRDFTINKFSMKIG